MLFRVQIVCLSCPVRLRALLPRDSCGTQVCRPRVHVVMSLSEVVESLMLIDFNA
jgi:hypothetical protein